MTTLERRGEPGRITVLTPHYDPAEALPADPRGCQAAAINE
jgi:hypothetical protein